MCQLHWVKGCPECWSTLFMGLSVMVFLAQSSFWMGKEDHTHCYGQTSSSLLKVEVGRIHSVCLSGDIYLLLPLGHWSFWFSGLQTRMGTSSTRSLIPQAFALGLELLLAFLGLQCMDDRSGDFSAHNHVSQFFDLSLHLYIFYWICFFGEPWLT